MMEARAGAVLQALGALRGFAVAGLDRPWASPRVRRAPPAGARRLSRWRTLALWELNEAFASQALYCQRQLGVAMERLNVNGGAHVHGRPLA